MVKKKLNCNLLVNLFAEIVAKLFSLWGNSGTMDESSVGNVHPAFFGRKHTYGGAKWNCHTSRKKAFAVHGKLIVTL
jgi:hypothetical protein